MAQSTKRVNAPHRDEVVQANSLSLEMEFMAQFLSALNAQGGEQTNKQKNPRSSPRSNHDRRRDYHDYNRSPPSSRSERSSSSHVRRDSDSRRESRYYSPRRSREDHYYDSPRRLRRDEYFDSPSRNQSYYYESPSREWKNYSPRYSPSRRSCYESPSRSRRYRVYESPPRQSSHDGYRGRDTHSPSPINQFHNRSPERDRGSCLSRTVGFASPPQPVRHTSFVKIPDTSVSPRPNLADQKARSLGLAPSSDESRQSDGSCPRSVPVSRTIIFDGTGCWKTFIMQFTSFADDHWWDAEQRKSHLCWSLEGDARSYLTLLLKHEPNILYSAILSKLDKRFVKRESPEVVLMQFTYARQAPDESVDQWADRLLYLASQAYPGLPEGFVQKQVATRFCQGSFDREAGRCALNSSPQTLENAVNLVKCYKHKDRAFAGQPRKEAPQASLSEDAVPEQNVCNVVMPVSTTVPVALEDRMSIVEDRMEHVGERVDALESTVQAMSASFVQIEHLQASVQSMKGTLQGLTEVIKCRNSPIRSRASPLPVNSSPGKGEDLAFGKFRHFKPEHPELVQSVEGVDARPTDDVSISQSMFQESQALLDEGSPSQDTPLCSDFHTLREKGSLSNILGTPLLVDSQSKLERDAPTSYLSGAVRQPPCCKPPWLEPPWPPPTENNASDEGVIFCRIKSSPKYIILSGQYPQWSKA